MLDAALRSHHIAWAVREVPNAPAASSGVIPARKSAAQRGYDHRWQKARAVFLRQHPLCQCPTCDEGNKRVTLATVVDHKIPHRGDKTLFWDRSNWQALAKQCHDSYKQRLEKSGIEAGSDVQGVPVDPMHHWNRKA